MLITTSTHQYIPTLEHMMLEIKIQVTIYSENYQGPCIMDICKWATCQRVQNVNDLQLMCTLILQLDLDGKAFNQM